MTTHHGLGAPGAVFCAFCDPPREIPGPVHYAGKVPCCWKHRPARNAEKVTAARQDVELFTVGESLLLVHFRTGGYLYGEETPVVVLHQNGRQVRVRREDGIEISTSTHRLRRASAAEKKR